MKGYAYVKYYTLILMQLLAIMSKGQDGYVDGNPALAYWKVGHKAQTVIVLHGGPAAQHGYLRPEFDAIRKSAKVIYYDQRGCGKSDTAGSYEWTDHVKDLQRVIHHFSPKKKVILAGSSWGSLFAMIYTYEHPEDVKALILSGTVRWPGQEMTEKGYLRMYSYYRHGPAKTSQYEITEYRRTLKIVDGKITPDTILVTKYATISLQAPQQEPLHSMATAPKIDSLKNITVPVLIFSGTINKPGLKDWGDIYFQIFPNATLFTIIAASHDPWFSNPGSFFAECNKFIKNVRKNK